MRLLTEITDEPKQVHLLQIDGVGFAKFQLEFKPNQTGWFYSLSIGDFAINNCRMVRAPNMLRQFNQKLEFGLALISNSAQDPLLQDAFSSGDAKLYLLTKAEALELESSLYGS